MEVPIYTFRQLLYVTYFILIVCYENNIISNHYIGILWKALWCVITWGVYMEFRIIGRKGQGYGLRLAVLLQLIDDLIVWKLNNIDILGFPNGSADDGQILIKIRSVV